MVTSKNQLCPPYNAAMAARMAALPAVGGGGSQPPSDDSDGPIPTAYPTLTDNGNGTYTVTPATWPAGVVPTNQTKRRDSVAVAGLSGTTITVAAEDAGKFIDYAETGTLNGKPRTVGSFGFAIPAASTSLLSTTGANNSFVPALPVYPILAANSVGTQQAKDLVKLGVPSGAGVLGHNLPSPVTLLVDAAAQTFTNSFKLNFNPITPVWDYDPDTGNYCYVALGSTIQIFTFINGTATLARAPAALPFDAYTEKSTVEITVRPTKVSIAVYGPDGVPQILIADRPAMPKQTTLFGIKLNAGYSDFQNWSMSASAAPFAITGMARTADGKFTATGAYQGAAPTSPIEYRIFDDRGRVIADYETMETTAANSALTLRATTVKGRNPAILNKACRFEFREVGKPAVTFGFLYTVPAFVEPAPAMVGSNISRGGRLQPYTNFLVNATCTMPGATDSVFGDGIQHVGRSTRLDANGNPLVIGLTYDIRVPDYDGDHILEVECDTGRIPYFDLNGIPWGDVTVVNSKLLRYRISSSQQFRSYSLRITDLDSSALPKGLKITLQGENKTQRFRTAFINFLKTWGGAGRFMDPLQTNWGSQFEYTTLDWAKRSRRSMIGTTTDGIPLEDLVEMLNLSNRPLWMNAHIGWFKDPSTEQHARKVFDLLYNGVGSDIGTGLTTSKRGIMELGNELWNERLAIGAGGDGSQLIQLALQARAAGRVSFDPNDHGARKNASTVERIYRYTRAMSVLEEVVPNFGSKMDRTFGLQMVPNDLTDCMALPGWEEARQHMDAVALAPYIPLDIHAGGGSATISDYSPEGITAALRERATEILEYFNSQVLRHSALSLRTHTYEWNLNVSAILGRTEEQERAWKSSQVAYNFMKNEIAPNLLPIGGSSCAYSDCGYASNADSWSMNEGLPPWAGNQLYYGVRDWGIANGGLMTA